MEIVELKNIMSLLNRWAQQQYEGAEKESIKWNKINLKVRYSYTSSFASISKYSFCILC